MKHSRLPACLAALMLIVAGCSDSDNNYAQYLEVLRQSFKGSFGKGNVTLKQAAAIPYASMGWRLNRGPQNIIVLATDNAQGQLWTSSAHIVFLTENGRIKRTVGLPADLSALAPVDAGQLIAPASALIEPYLLKLSMDLAENSTFNIAIDCHGSVRGSQVITILSKKITTRLVQEQCEAQALSWSFTNNYWIDRDSGMVWRSLQHINPRGDTLETEIFRPPS